MLKSILAIIIIAALAIGLLYGANEQQALNEAKEYRALKQKIVSAKVGSFVKLDGHGFLKTSRPTKEGK